MNKNLLLRKIHPWRNCIAALFTFLLVASCVLLLLRSRRAMSLAAIRSSEIFRRYDFVYPAYEYDLYTSGENFHHDFNQTYSGLYGQSSPFHSGEKFSFGDGDIVGIHSGGRSRNPEGLPEKGSDARRWLDARVALGGNSRIRFYGAGSVGLQPGEVAGEQAEVSRTANPLSVGGGFGFSYRLNENTELLFDYRHSAPLDENSSCRKSDAAGLTLRFSF